MNVKIVELTGSIITELRKNKKFELIIDNGKGKIKEIEAGNTLVDEEMSVETLMLLIRFIYNVKAANSETSLNTNKEQKAKFYINKSKKYSEKNINVDFNPFEEHELDLMEINIVTKVEKEKNKYTMILN